MILTHDPSYSDKIKFLFLSLVKTLQNKRTKISCFFILLLSLYLAWQLVYNKGVQSGNFGGLKIAANTLIVFAYSPGEFRDPNLEFFVKKGGILNDSRYDYVFIASGAQWSKMPVTKHIKKFSNILELMERDNFGYDICAWKEVLSKYGKQYSRFILLNGSVRGPFLPNYVHEPWPELFLKPLENSDVGLSGTTFNCHNTHIQSPLLAFSRAAYSIIYNTLACFESKKEAIAKCEMGFSGNVLDSGLNLHVMSKYFQGHDFRDKITTKEKCQGIPYDHYYQNAYFGIDYHPFEIIFMKTNRNISPKVIENYSKWTKEVQEFRL